MNKPNPRVIVYGTPKRDLFIAIGAGLAVLLFVLGAIFWATREQGAPSTNQLTGTITAKHNSGEKVSEITYGKKGLSEREADSGYSFDIHVDAENRTYEVPVAKALYDAKKVGDKQSFIRPPSEQK
jgi:hypothetical protein